MPLEAGAGLAAASMDGGDPGRSRGAVSRIGGVKLDQVRTSATADVGFSQSACFAHVWIFRRATPRSSRRTRRFLLTQLTIVWERLRA